MYRYPHKSDLIGQTVGRWSEGSLKNLRFSPSIIACLRSNRMTPEGEMANVFSRKNPWEKGMIGMGTSFTIHFTGPIFLMNIQCIFAKIRTFGYDLFCMNRLMMQEDSDGS